MSKYALYGMCLQVLFLSVVSAKNGNAQSEKLKDIDVTVNWQSLELEQAFSDLNRKTGFSFNYHDGEIDVNQSITLNIESASMHKVLRSMSQKAGLKFRRINSSIHVGKLKGSEKVISEQIISPMEVEISGKVTDENGEGLPGASVVEKGTTNGTVTDLNGNFNLSVSDGATISVSFVGYQTQEIAIGNSSSLNIRLVPDLETLDEIVVVGYGTAKRKDLTGAIASVDLDQTRDLPNANVAQSLRGTVPGVRVIDNGRPGSDATILIRGRNSITASNDPLIVLDGIIYTGGRLSDINPGDIESIHILKDASSLAIYGSLAANGVIEITTKKGTSDKPTVSLNAYYGASDFAHVPDYLNADEYLAQRQDLETLEGGPIPFQPIEQENISEGNIIDPWEEIKQDAPVYNAELSVAGKTERTSYYLSGSYTNSKAPVLGDNFSRVSGRINLETVINNWLTLGMNSSYTVRDNSGSRANLEQAAWLSPYASLYYEDGLPRKQPMDIGLVGNPIFGEVYNDNERTQKTLFINAYSDIYLPIEGLSYRLNTGYTQRNDNNFNYRPTYEREAFFNLGSGDKTHYEIRNFTLENIVRYSKSFNDKHEINATLMYGIYELRDERSFLSSNNIFNDALGWNSLEIGENFNIDSDAGEEKQVSSLGRLNYRYKGRYIVDFSIRRDGYSAFGPGNKYAVFPSVGISWNIIEEDFMSRSELMDHLKLRLSWGKNGNRGVSRYSSLSTMSVASYVFGDGAGSSVGLYPTSFANPNLGWETTTSTNIGLDFGLLSNRVSGSIDYYHSNTDDLLLRQVIPNTNGYDTFLRNIGATSNRGLEIGLNTINIKAGAFEWGSSVAFTLNRNEIEKLTGNDLDGDGIEDDDIASKWFIGHPLGTNFDYAFDGIYQVGDDFSAIQGAKAGDIRFKDVDGDGVITPDDRQILHSSQPKFELGFVNNFNYRGFSLLVVLNWRQGGYSPNPAINPGTNFSDQANYFDVPYWMPENPISTHAALNYKNPLGYLFYQSRTFVRLQDISLSYQIPGTILERIGLQSAKIFVSGKNLATWTDWIGWDPEHGAGGRNPGVNGPLMKTYSTGINIQF